MGSVLCLWGALWSVGVSRWCSLGFSACYSWSRQHMCPLLGLCGLLAHTAGRSGCTGRVSAVAEVPWLV